MAARKKCPKCGAGNDSDALACNLCGQKLPPAVRTTMEAFELEPRQWTGNSQRRRGEKTDEGSGAPAGSSTGKATPIPPPANEAAPAPVQGSGHFLLPPVGPPLKLEANISSFVFGRDEACSVRIASAKVSRRHAELRWRGLPGVLVLRDLNSQNGTYLNDKKLTEEVALSDGDTIRMGDYIANYKYVPEGDDIANMHQHGSETAVMETVVVYPEAKLDEGGALTGDATILPIHEVLRRLLALHAHGILAIDVGGTKGQMKLVDGRAVDGFYAGLEGSHAVQAMASLTKGRFRFDPDPDAPPLRASQPTARIEKPPSDLQHVPGAPAARPAPAHAPGPPGGAPRGPAPAPGPRPAGAPPPPRPGTGTAPGAAPRPAGAPPPAGPRPGPRPPGSPS